MFRLFLLCQRACIFDQCDGERSLKTVVSHAAMSTRCLYVQTRGRQICHAHAGGGSDCRHCSMATGQCRHQPTHASAAIAPGTIDLHDWTTSATDLNAPELLTFDQQWHQQTLARIQANQQQLVSEPTREQISLAEIDFWQTTYRLRQPDQSRLRIEALVGVVAGTPLQITVTIDDNVDARSYEELQAILVKQVMMRK